MSKQIFFTVGPSQLYPTVSKHIIEALEDNIGSISHRSKQFQAIFDQTTALLRKLMNIPSDYQIFFLSSALEAMELIIENCVERFSFHFVNGAFAQKFFDFALDLKKNPAKTESPFGLGFDFKKAQIPKDTELICLTQNETSTGVLLSMDDIYKLKKLYPDKLIAIDVVSSVPYVKIDFSKIDLVFFSVQKGFGLPAGLGVLIVSPKALEKSKALQKKGFNVGTFRKFSVLSKSFEKLQTPGTPNVLYIYLLGKVIDDMLIRGVGEIREITDKKAKLIYDYFDKHKEYKPLVKEKIWRSSTTIVIDVKGKAEETVGKLKKKGFIVGKGYGDYKDMHIRIANFPSHSLKDIKKLLQTF